ALVCQARGLDGWVLLSMTLPALRAAPLHLGDDLGIRGDPIGLERDTRSCKRVAVSPSVETFGSLSNTRCQRHSSKRKDVEQRATAALIGAAVGDALGATTEFMVPSEIQLTYGVLRDIVGGGWLRLSAGQVTDDTQMALCVARSIAVRGWCLEDVANRFVEWLRSRPLDVGNTCRRGIRRYMTHATLAGPPLEDDAGNGAVMRVAPVALATLGNVPLLVKLAIEQAHITHNHFLSDSACVLAGSLLQMACLGSSKLRLLKLAREFVAEVPKFTFQPYRRLCTAYVVDTMQTVLHYFFSTRSFEDCLVGTVNQGGDADTAGAIVGAVAGAYYGLEAIPERWVRQLSPELVQELRDLAQQLVDVSPLGAEEVLTSSDEYAGLIRVLKAGQQTNDVQSIDTER
ncbi:MAG: ADP-ribosyl-[dinitrogen reductase] hydrolase, partial [Myxococcales bacterium]